MKLNRQVDRELTPWVQASQNEMREKIQIAVERLTFRERFVLKLRCGLHHHEGFEYSDRDISRLHRMNVRKVRKLEESAKANLKRIFEKLGIDAN